MTGHWIFKGFKNFYKSSFEVNSPEHTDDKKLCCRVHKFEMRREALGVGV